MHFLSESIDKKELISVDSIITVLITFQVAKKVIYIPSSLIFKSM